MKQRGGGRGWRRGAGFDTWYLLVYPLERVVPSIPMRPRIINNDDDVNDCF